jgi:hypothetical protein
MAVTVVPMPPTAVAASVWWVSDRTATTTIEVSPVRTVTHVSQTELGSPVVVVVRSMCVTRSVLPTAGRTTSTTREGDLPAASRRKQGPLGGLPSSCHRRAFSVATTVLGALTVEGASRNRTNGIDGIFRRSRGNATLTLRYFLSRPLAFLRHLSKSPGHRAVGAAHEGTTLCAKSHHLCSVLVSSLHRWMTRILPPAGSTGAGEELTGAEGRCSPVSL